MKKLLKLAFILVLLGLMIIIGGVLFVSARANQLAKRAVEEGGSYALGVPTKVDSVKLGIFSGEFGLKGLDVANPSSTGGAAYTSPRFLGLGSGEVKVDYSALQQPVVTLPALTLSDIDVSLEKKGGKANYQVILENLKKLQDSGGTGGGKPSSKPAGEEQKFVITKLLITNVNISVDMLDAGGLSQLAKVRIPIEKIELDNVGKTGDGVKGTGVTMEELVSIVVQAVLKATTEQGGSILPGELLGDLQGSLGQLDGLKGLPLAVIADPKKVVDDLAGKVKDMGKDVGDKLKDAGKDVGDKLKDGLDGLLGGGKDKKKDEDKKKDK